MPVKTQNQLLAERWMAHTASVRVASNYLEILAVPVEIEVRWTSRLAADYEKYLKKKKRRNEKPLSRKEWEIHQGQGKGEAEIADAKPGAKDEEKGGEHGHEEGDEHWEHGHKTVKEELKSFGKGVQRFLKSAPKALIAFITDPGARKQTLSQAQEQIKQAPQTAFKRAETAMKVAWHHEKTEFVDAGKGLGQMIQGKKLKTPQKKALKTLATHAVIATVASALGHGLGLETAEAVGTAVFVTGPIFRVVTRIVGSALADLGATTSASAGNYPMLHEVGEILHHLGHHVGHLSNFIKLGAEEEDGEEDDGQASDGGGDEGGNDPDPSSDEGGTEGKPGPELIFQIWTMLVSKNILADLDEETLKTAVEEAAEGGDEEAEPSDEEEGDLDEPSDKEEDDLDEDE